MFWGLLAVSAARTWRPSVCGSWLTEKGVSSTRSLDSFFQGKQNWFDSMFGVYNETCYAW